MAWARAQATCLRLLDAKGAAVLEFTEVESGIYEGERNGEGLFFMQTQAALKAETPTADQMFGDWKLLRELDKPLCTLTLSNAADGDDKYKVVVKPRLRRSDRRFRPDDLAARPRPARC